jgi:hypothetical protein
LTIPVRFATLRIIKQGENGYKKKGEIYISIFHFVLREKKDDNNMIKNELQLNMEQDGWLHLQTQCDFEMGILNSTDLITNKTKKMNSLMIQFENITNLHIEFVKATHKYIEDTFNYNLGVVLDENDSALFLCDDKYNMSTKQFEKIYSSVDNNMHIICGYMRDAFVSLLSTKSKKEIDNHTKKLYEFLDNHRVL